MPESSWFLRAEAAWNRDLRRIAGVLRDALGHVRAHPLSFGGFVLAWLVPLLPWLACLPDSVLRPEGSRAGLGLIVLANSIGRFAAELTVCLFLFRQYALASRDGGTVFEGGWRRWGGALPFILGAYFVYWGIGAIFALSLPLISPLEAGRSWTLTTLKWQLTGLLARLPMCWVVCRFGGALGAMAAGDDPSLRRAWRMTAGQTRVLLYTCLLWFLAQRALPGFASFPLYELLGEHLAGWDWLSWFWRVYAAAVWAFFTLVSAAWYERLRRAAAPSPQATATAGG